MQVIFEELAINMRSSLLINCSLKEAKEIRKGAGFQRRTVSGYVLHIVMRSVKVTEEIASALETQPSSIMRSGMRGDLIRPRTTLHVYCTADEAKGIRRAARRRQSSISGFVLACLHRHWIAEEELARMQQKQSRLSNRRHSKSG